MSNWWPWLVMGLGVISLFCYRYRLFLLNNEPKISNEAIILESSHAGTASQAPAAAAPQSRPSPIAKIRLENEDVKIPDLELQQAPAPAPKKTGRAPAHYASEQVWMPVIISIIVLLSALFVILSNNTYGDAQQKWAFGVVGTIIGYWFKK
jgi:hypothetical protein